MEAKLCSCSEHEGENPLPVSEFGKNRAAPDGLQYRCKACHNRSQRRYQQANPEKQREAQRRWLDANPGYQQRWREDNPEYGPEYQRRRMSELCDQVFGHYGRACSCCGSTGNLTIDHIDGNGRQHCLELFGRASSCTDQLYRWLIAEGFPEGFQTLCFSCNSSKKGTAACRRHHR